MFFLELSTLFIAFIIFVSLTARISTFLIYKKYRKRLSASGVNGYGAALEVLDANDMSYIRIEKTSFAPFSYFDKRTNVICLVSDVYRSGNLSAIGTAAHEAAHAVQFSSSGYALILRSFAIASVKIFAYVFIICTAIGTVFSREEFVLIALAFFILFALLYIFTIHIDINASKIAFRAFVKSEKFTRKELAILRKVLSAAVFCRI